MYVESEIVESIDIPIGTLMFGNGAVVGNIRYAIGVLIVDFSRIDPVSIGARKDANAMRTFS